MVMVFPTLKSIPKAPAAPVPPVVLFEVTPPESESSPPAPPAPPVIVPAEVIVPLVAAPLKSTPSPLLAVPAAGLVAAPGVAGVEGMIEPAAVTVRSSPKVEKFCVAVRAVETVKSAAKTFGLNRKRTNGETIEENKLR
jgi:hypothetical protein